MGRETVVKSYNAAELNKLKDNEVFSKMNYLFQLAQMARQESEPLANYYLREFGLTAQKRVARVDNSISKDYCRKCLVFFNKAKYTILKQGNKTFLVKKCEICKRERKQFLSAKASEQVPISNQEEKQENIPLENE